MTDAATPHLVIVGGGLTGLGAAHQAAPAAADGRLRVTLLEASDRLGGMVRTKRDQGLVVEEGPDSFLVRKPWARELCVALGLDRELVATPPRNRRSFVYHAGRLHPIPAGLALGVPGRVGPFLRSGLLSPGGKARALLDLVLPRVLAPGGGDVSLGAFLRARLGREVVQRLAEPLLSGIYAGGAEDLSLNATFPDLRRQEGQYRSLIRAAVADARSHTARKAAAAEPSAPPPPFVTLRGGLDAMVRAVGERLAATSGVTVRTAAPVLGLERSGRGGMTVRLEGEEVHADGVIVTAPAPHAAALLRHLAPDAARELSCIAYADVALVAFALGQSALAHDLAGSGFVVARGEDIDVTACTWVSSKWPDSAPQGTVLLRFYLGRAGSAVLERDDDALVDTARAALARAMGITAAPAWTHVVRVPRGLPQYAVHHLARVERIESAVAHVPGLWVTGAAFRGVGLPDCVRQGQEAAEAATAWLASADALPT